MNRPFIEQQKALALQRLERFGDKDGPEKEAVAIVSGYLSSLLYPENFTDAQKEDLRKLALEVGYKEDTDFTKWVPKVPVSTEKV